LVPLVVGLAPSAIMLFRASLAPLCGEAVVVAERLTVTDVGLAMPDLLVIDLDDGAADPLEMLRMTRFVLPTCFIAVYSHRLERRWARSCHLAGANCMLSKRSDAAQLQYGLGRMLDDGCFTDPHFSRDAFASF